MKEASLMDLAYLTINTITGNKLGSDDSTLSERYFMRQWVYHYSRKVYDEIEKHKNDKLNPTFLRKFCLKLSRDNDPICKCGTEKTIFSGDIPKLMSINGELKIDSIYLAGGKPISLISKQDFSFSAKMSPNSSLAYIVGSKIYVSMCDTDLNCNVELIGVPQTITATSSCSYYYLAKTPINPEWVEEINRKIITVYSGLILETKRYSDRKNDALDVVKE